MTNKILLTYIGADLLFLISGGLLIIFALTTEAQNSSNPTVKTVANDLLLQTCPLNGMYTYFHIIDEEQY